MLSSLWLWLSGLFATVLAKVITAGLQKKEQIKCDGPDTANQKSVQNATQEWYNRTHPKLVLLALLLLPGCALSFTDKEKTHFVPNEAPVQLAKDITATVWCEQVVVDPNNPGATKVERWKTTKKIVAGAWLVYLDPNTGAPYEGK
jgi:hypothetical protein